ncbi:MAG: response regulator transcription factor [Armatimonadetes bacterium]|nr:response regulator transcription factor [Armatimonadota bacterium]MDE2205735.1 response regulator transcription factor [Armatimonadota bacterium]
MGTLPEEAASPVKVLVVDDEIPIVEAVTYNLRKEGYATLQAFNAEEALALAGTEKPDLIILDVMLPASTGFEVCKRLRQASRTPIIMLTARADETDRVVGLELGADDYVTKPFSMRELMVRVRNLVQRAKAAVPDPDETVRAGDLTIEPSRREVRVAQRSVDLTPREFDLLRYLAAHPERVFNRQELLDAVWGPNAYVEDRTVDVHIRWLREKIEEQPSAPRRLLTVRGIGYRFRPVR